MNVNSIAVRLLLLCVFLSPFARADDRATVIVADDGGLDRSTVHALRSIAVAQLRKRGIAAADHDQPGARTFNLRVGGRLGAKIPLTFEEVAGDRLIASASLNAARIEDADIVMERLVNAVVDRRAPEDNATLSTVTEQEARRPRKKQGERFILIGLPLPLYGTGTFGGFSLGYGYEADVWRIEVFGEYAQRGGVGAGLLGFGADWIPFESEFSPYLGGGLGYGGATGYTSSGAGSGTSNSGLAFKLDAGIEAFRLYGVRVLAGVDLLIPLSASNGVNSKTVYPVGHLRFAF
jgi:hypothetical protein